MKTFDGMDYADAIRMAFATGEAITVVNPQNAPMQISRGDSITLTAQPPLEQNGVWSIEYGK